MNEEVYKTHPIVNSSVPLEIGDVEMDLFQQMFEWANTLGQKGTKVSNLRMIHGKDLHLNDPFHPEYRQTFFVCTVKKENMG